MKIATAVCFAAAAFLAAGALHAADPATITNSVGMTLVLIPAGEFQMGAEEDPAATVKAFPYALPSELQGETPRHPVRITTPFYMGAYEVTLREFLKFYHDAKYKLDAERDKKPSWGFNPKGVLVKSVNFRPWHPGWKQTQDHPVNYVSWNDALAFCNWLSQTEGKKYRLPTEAEWEYACRAGTTTRYSSGNDPEDLVQIGNVADQDCQRWKPKATVAYFDKSGNNYDTRIPFPYLSQRDGFVFTAPVGKFRPNAFGLYDMHGNVWEWCQDWFDTDYYATLLAADPDAPDVPAVDPQGPAGGVTRVSRGGAWWRAGPVGIRSARRRHYEPAYRDCFIGFRVVCEE